MCKHRLFLAVCTFSIIHEAISYDAARLVHKATLQTKSRPSLGHAIILSLSSPNRSAREFKFQDTNFSSPPSSTPIVYQHRVPSGLELATSDGRYTRGASFPLNSRDISPRHELQEQNIREHPEDQDCQIQLDSLSKAPRSKQSRGLYGRSLNCRSNSPSSHSENIQVLLRRTGTNSKQPGEKPTSTLTPNSGIRSARSRSSARSQSAPKTELSSRISKKSKPCSREGSPSAADNTCLFKPSVTKSKGRQSSNRLHRKLSSTDKATGDSHRILNLGSQPTGQELSGHTRLKINGKPRFAGNRATRTQPAGVRSDKSKDQLAGKMEALSLNEASSPDGSKTKLTASAAGGGNPSRKKLSQSSKLPGDYVYAAALGLAPADLHVGTTGLTASRAIPSGRADAVGAGHPVQAVAGGTSYSGGYVFAQAVGNQVTLNVNPGPSGRGFMQTFANNRISGDLLGPGQAATLWTQGFPPGNRVYGMAGVYGPGRVEVKAKMRTNIRDP